MLKTDIRRIDYTLNRQSKQCKHDQVNNLGAKAKSFSFNFKNPTRGCITGALTKINKSPRQF